jgi:hypothetical protein
MKNTSKKILSMAAGAVFCCALFAPTVQAVPLPPGADVPATSFAGPTGNVATGGGPLVSFFASPGPSNSFSGNIRSAVITNDSTNPFGTSGLTFVYQVFNDLSSLTTLKRLTVEGFATFGVEANFMTATNALLASLGFSNSTGGNAADRFDRSVNGDVVGTNFFQFTGNHVQQGEFGAILVFQTNARFFQQNDANIIDGGVATGRVLAPRVPEGGSTLAFLGIALVVAEGVRRKICAA